ncbi:MAG: ferrous iron transport protein A [Anaerolineales bacterium]
MQKFECPLCGTSYDISARIACSTCPIGRDCQMVCCPNCGHTTIDPSQSKLANWVGNLFGQPAEKQARRTLELEMVEAIRLSQIKVGEKALILDMNGLPEQRKRHLSAYGVTPGVEVTIRQQTPLTIFEVDHTELALEEKLAASILVQPASE